MSQIKKFECEIYKKVTIKYNQILINLKIELNKSKTLEDLKKFAENLCTFINEVANEKDKRMLELKDDISQIINQLINAMNTLNVNQSKIEIEQGNQQQNAIPKQENEKGEIASVGK